MADVYGVNYTKTQDPKPENMISGIDTYAPVRWVTDSYETVATASGTVIYLGYDLPAGAKIMPESKIFFDAQGANTEFKVGVYGDDDLLETSVVATSAGSAALGTIDTFGTALSSAAPIIVTSIGSGAMTGTFRLSLYYSMY